MNFLFLTETESGCWKWRGKIPAKYLRRRGHTVQVYDRGTANYDRPDVMVFFRTNFVRAEEILDWCKAEGVRIVFDTDDALDMVPTNNPAASVSTQFLPDYHKLAEVADVVTTTTPTLAEHLRKRNPNVMVLPNSVDPEEWEPNPSVNNQIKRIGWQGGSTHFNDLGMIADAVRIAQRRKPFTFVMQGLCAERTPGDCYILNAKLHGKKFTESQFGKSMKWFLDRIMMISGEFHPSVPVDQHAARIQSLKLDVGLAPLVEGRFNSYKSCIKFYEYALAGAATIASRVLPYSLECPTVVRNTTAAWADVLTEAADSDQTLVAKQQREWVMEYRNMQTNVALWEQAYSPSHA